MKAGKGTREGDCYIKKKTIQILQEEEPGQRTEASSDKAASPLTTSNSRQAPDHLEGCDYIPFIDASFSSTNTVRNAQ